MDNQKAIYLACPYWHENENVRLSRFERVTDVTGKIMQRGYVVFSPITHSHPVALDMDTGEHRPGGKLGHDFWLRQDAWYLSKVDEMWILMLDGWKESYGVAWEADFCCNAYTPVRHLDNSSLLFVNPDTLEVLGAP